MNICVVKSTNDYDIWFHAACRSTEKLPSLLSAKGNGSLVCRHTKRGDAGPSFSFYPTFWFNHFIILVNGRHALNLVRTKRTNVQRSQRSFFVYPIPEIRSLETTTRTETACILTIASLKIGERGMGHRHYLRLRLEANDRSPDKLNYLGIHDYYCILAQRCGDLWVILTYN